MPTRIETPSWRLFLGLWPAAETRDQVARHANAWQWPLSARRTPAERLHITLHFLGNVAAERVPALKQGLSFDWPGCTLELDRAEVWPGGIAVLEASRVPPQLAALHARLGAALADLGLPVETRRYRPHVTLARKGQGARVPEFTSLQWETGKRYALVRSFPGGYVTVHTFG